MGIAVQQNGQSLVLGAAGGGAPRNLFAVRTVRKIANATIAKLITVFRNCP
jgi:preprotein translocase subunit SecG